ncbi:hypothetical protein MBLNU230_g8150t1 [Neophaeotheca triangularis]
MSATSEEAHAPSKQFKMTSVFDSAAEEKQDPACKRTLETYELLEMILHKLTQKELLSVLQVCRSWKSLIDTSHPLQRALFLKAVDAPKLHELEDDMKYIRETKEYKDLQKEQGTLGFSKDHLFADHQQWHEAKHPLFVNPILRLEPFSWSKDNHCGVVKFGVDGTHFPLDGRFEATPLLPASAYNMFVSQPPVTTLTLDWGQDGVHWFAKRKLSGGPELLRNAHGITLRDVVRATEEMIGRYGPVHEDEIPPQWLVRRSHVSGIHGLFAIVFHEQGSYRRNLLSANDELEECFM